MASRKKQAEGIALLSMYNDEDDEEMEDIEEEEKDDEYREVSNVEEGGEDDSRNKVGVSSDFGLENTPQGLSQNSTPAEGKFSHLTPQQVQVLFSSSPQQQQRVALADTRRSGKERLTIVDYGHDEVAMSPEPEPVKTDATNHIIIESEAAEVENACNVCGENVDPLDLFLPPPPKEKCTEDLQRKIDKFLALKKIGKSFNAEVRNRKDYRNPDFLLHAVRYQDIDQIGSCFSKDVFDPHGYDKSDYYDEIEVDMKRERERKEQENKKNQKVEFHSGGTQPGIVTSAPKPNIPIPGVPALVAGGLPSATDAGVRDGRPNKKTKWDKVDGDRRNPLPSGGQDSLSAVGAHAALLSAANAGAGYTAFAQQRRREAEEKRCGERKL
ncbi:uncharacterized protein LOC110822040 [Carica papaya]|uniref:uncharacterized protein LOC110822040 n=1 Tax=Carica papaya TaxID=3649 RepID=UPI000B8C8C08|nr:uncharacterized protein LOC110822040 [Carica papaya]